VVSKGLLKKLNARPSSHGTDAGTSPFPVNEDNGRCIVSLQFPAQFQAVHIARQSRSKTGARRAIVSLKDQIFLRRRQKTSTLSPRHSEDWESSASRPFDLIPKRRDRAVVFSCGYNFAEEAT